MLSLVAQLPCLFALIFLVLFNIDGSHQGKETKIHMKRKCTYQQNQINMH